MQHATFTFQTITRQFITLLFVVFTSGLFAQASLSVQGVLTKSDGTAVDDGTYTVTFKLFDAPTGGNEVHSEPIDIETIGGVYSTVLGQNPAFPMTAPFNTIYYLSVRVGSSELLPRPQLTHSPYALSLLGQSNQFPSSGRVNADYIVVPGGNPSGGIANKGYSFGTGGDPDGGMFSNGDNNVSLWANATKKIEITNSANTLYGPTATNDLTVNGNEVASGYIRASNGFVTNSNNNTGLFAGGGDEFFLKTGGNNRMWAGNDLKFQNNHDVVFDATGAIITNGLFKMNSYIYANGMTINTNGGYSVFLDPNSKELIAKNSSRRFKSNIKPLHDDFKRILLAQPRTYTRPESKNPNFVELGFIAEEMDSLGLKNLVIYDNKGQIGGVYYDLIPIYNLEVLKMHEATINQLQAQVAALKTENASLKASNTALNTSLEKQQSEISAQLNDLSKRMKLMESSRGVKDDSVSGEK